MLAWLAPLVVLGVVVFVHELGHFLAAKSVGVYAPRFSLGWGSPIFRWRPRGGETEYVISWLPIGGYVRMASRDDETASMLEGGNETVAEGAALDPNWDPEAMVPHGPKPVPSDRWFESKATWQRVVILLAGVVMNVVLTLTVSTGIFAVNGRRYVPAVIDSVIPGYPAVMAGLRGGDSIAAVDGSPVKNWSELTARVSRSPGRSLTLDVVRGGTHESLVMVPKTDTAADPMTGKAGPVGRIGAFPRPTTASEPLSFGESVATGWHATWQMGGAVVGVLGGLFRGSVSVATLGGPIAIARTSVAAAKTGLEPLFSLIAFLSINLAVLNLLPIPLLDGGQVLMTVAEGVRGKPFGERSREWVMRVGIAVVGLLFVTVMFNDLKSLVLSLIR